ncbi:MAG: prepilin peptidase [Saccharofermentanales bacterium]
MNIFALAINNIAFLLLTAAGSFGLYRLYNHMPPAWFMEHPGIAEPGSVESGMPPSYRIRKFPDSILFCFSTVFLSFVFFIQYGYSLLLICNLVPLVFFAMIFVSDIKTGIIPDQFIAGLIFSSLFWIFHDISVLLASHQPLYSSLTGRIPAALCGGAIIFLMGRIGGLLLKQEAMGMGDVKLIFACGLIVDFEGIFWVIILSFLIAFIPALIGIVYKKRRIIPPGVFGAGQLPFAPFIVAAAILYMVFPAEFAFLAAWYSGL